jgi:hypothetical protein
VNVELVPPTVYAFDRHLASGRLSGNVSCTVPIPFSSGGGFHCKCDLRLNLPVKRGVIGGVCHNVSPSETVRQDGQKMMPDRMRLAILRTLQWLGDLSPVRSAVVIVAFLVLLVVSISIAVHYGLLPTREHRYDPIFSW